MVKLNEFYQTWFNDDSKEGRIKIHYTTLAMVSNLHEILKAMQIKSDEELFGKVLEMMKEDDMLTFLTLTASMLNPVTTYARSNIKYAFDYIVKEYKADKTKFLYLQLGFNVI